MGYREHFMKEFRAAGWLKEPVDEMQQLMMDQLLEIGDLFASHGHSGFSASYSIDCLNKLLRFEPLVPLTGEDWEWNEVSEQSGYECYQNNRCSTVFKQADRFDGQPYDINGKVFWEWYECELYEDEEGYPGITNVKTYYTSSDSFVPITFPYTPTTEYVFKESESE